MKKVNLSKFSDYTFESIPSWALPYIVNGDIEGLSKEDISLVEKWENKMRERGFKPDMFDFVREDENGEIYLDPEQEAYFDSFPAFGLPSDCYTCLFVKL